MSKRKSESLKSKMGRLGARLDDLIERAEKTRDYAKKINVDELLRQKTIVERELKALRLPARKAWKDLQAGMSAAWDDMKAAFARAGKQFKK